MSKGYDLLPMLYQSILDIPMFEGAGALAHDISRQVALDKTMALTGGTIAWAQVVPSNTTVIQFTAATPDYLTLSALESTDLDFTTGAFSGLIWVYPTLLAGDLRYLFCKGGTVDGWFFCVSGNNGAMHFDTCKAGPSFWETTSTVGEVVLNTWHLLGFSRLTTSVRLYKNGIDVTDAASVHQDPDTAAARVLNIGVTLGVTAAYQGYLWRPRLFDRQLSAVEMAQIFQMERSLFGV